MSGKHSWIHTAVFVALLSLAVSCGPKTDQSAPATNNAPVATEPSAPSAPVVPAPAVTQASWAPDALEELLAPIALYPDALLAQVLAASINAQEVLDAGNWLLQNQTLTGDALDAAAEKAGFGPATRALVQFPTVVDMMCQQIDWTRQLGSAFTSDQKSVLDAVQRLRTQAVQIGNLQSTPEQKVETKKESDKVIVEVKPADPKVVYVPQYDPQQVYTTPPPQPAPAPTSSSTSSTVSTGSAVAGALLAFGVGIALGHALDDHDCYPHWSTGVVFYGPRPFYPPAYVYRPMYGPAFHPAYRYAPPPGYRHSYNNINVNVNVNRNIVVNNNNYFNRFDNNHNLRADHVQSPLGNTRQGGTQNRATAGRSDSWRGQATYAGARNNAATDRTNRVGTAAATHNNEPRPGAPARANPASTRHVKQDRPQHVDRGYGESTRVASRDTSRGTPRDTAAASHQADVARQGSHENAFSGAARERTGSFERAASARGRASAGGRSAHVAQAGRRR
jgi:hypothetical protein